MSSAVQCSLSVLELPGRAEAEAALRAAQEGCRPCFAAVLVAGGLLAAGERFGYRQADGLLLAYGRHWMGALGSGSRLYRWSGTAFLAILERDNPLEDVAAEVSRRAENLLIGWVDCSGNRMPVVIGTQAGVVRLDDGKAGAGLIRSMDYFVATSVS